MKLIPCLAVLGVLIFAAPTRADLLATSYTELTTGTTIDLTATGTLDWIKFGNGENNNTVFLNTTKIGNPVFLPATFAPLGTAPAGFSVALIAFTGQGNLNFNWTNGNFGMYNGTGPVDTVVTETLVPAANSYPIGLGATFQALAAGQTRSMDVYVQGFDAKMVLTASLDGGLTSTPIEVTPTQNPPSDPNNDYALGVFHIDYAGAGQILTINVFTEEPRTTGAQADFANAGFFAATVTQATQTPEPATLVLLVTGAAMVVGCRGWRRRVAA